MIIAQVIIFSLGAYVELLAHCANFLKNCKCQDKILENIFNYRNFVNENIITITEKIQNSKWVSIVNSRVKTLNSIQYKIQNYYLNHENGEIPLKKCLNDIFGIRIILDEKVDYFNIRNIIKLEFPELKCINSNKMSYYAVHIYFGNDNNKNFQWELQIWDKEHEKKNLESHTKYKQDYTKWEQENTGRN